MISECRKVAGALIDIAENNLEEAQKKSVQDHLAACPRCNRLVHNFAWEWERLSAAEKRAPSKRFWPGLIAKIQAREEPKPVREKIIAGLKHSFRPIAVSLILLFGVFFGYQLGNAPRPESAQSQFPYVEPLFGEFQDFPEGSVSDFYMQYDIQRQQEDP